MPPNNKYKETMLALPYDQPVYKLGPQSDEPPIYHQASSHQELSDEEEEPSLQVTTRARVTYELDRYSKNEMLLISNSSIEPEVIMCVLNAFRVHKFVFTIIETDLSEENEIWQKINCFFSKDFTNIGAIAILTLVVSQGAEPSPTRFGEWDVLNHFIRNQPSTLNGRPKIFISEAPEPSTLEMIRLPMDTLVIQTKKVTHERSTRPLELLCHKLANTNGRCELLELISEVKHKSDQLFNTQAVSCISMMTKDLLMEKDENELKFERFMADMIENPNLIQIYERFDQSLLANNGEYRYGTWQVT